MTRKTHTLKTSLNHQITVFTEDHISQHIQKYGLYEKERLLLLNALLDKLTDPVVLDIGANIGNHSLAFSTKAKQVHAFEPIPEVFSLMEKNIAQNNIQNIVVHNIALSDTEDEATIYMVKEGNVGMSSFDKRGDEVEPVQVFKQIGDIFVENNGINKIDFIKIDVEAHEYYVIKGLMNSIRKHKPIITLEWNDPLTIERFSGSEELSYLLEEYTINVLGINYDRTYWQNKPFAFLKRKLTRLLLPRKAVIYDFNPTWYYDSLLLIPKGQEPILDSLV